MAKSRATAAPGSATVAFAGGGTAGHVFPGIAVARELGRRVLWIGATGGVERGMVTDAGIDFRGIPAGKLRRYMSLRNLTDVMRTIAGIAASVRILRRERPRLVFSKGGFVSVPPVVAAWLCGIPSWTHESDFDPGLATKINSRFSEKILVSFPQTIGFLPKRYRHKAVLTGNPVRATLFQGDAARGRSFVGCLAGVPLVLVLGGSQGSAAINRLVEAGLPRLPERCFVVHQTGRRADEGRRDAGYFAAPFFGAELPDLMAAADLIVSRAGANTLSEIAALGKPSVLIPLTAGGSRGDQLRNAEVFRAAGASFVLRETEATAESLARVIRDLLSDEARLRELGRRAGAMGSAGTAEEIARLISRRLA